METEVRDRIPVHTIVLMGSVAFYYDTLQALTTSGAIGFILSSFITIFAWFNFYVWYKIKGVNFFEGKTGKIIAKRLAPFLASMIAELIPGLNVAPTLTIGVVITAVFVHLEDLAVRKEIISAEDLEKMQKYLMGNKRILTGNIHKSDLSSLYSYGEKRAVQKLQSSPKGQQTLNLVNKLPPQERQKLAAGTKKKFVDSVHSRFTPAAGDSQDMDKAA